ncbi:MFS transporter [Bradyrhizobium sp. UFLA06-06]
MTMIAPMRTLGGQGLLLTGILLIASTLRAPITGVAPMLGMIGETSGISAAEAGILTTLPLLAFAAISPVAAVLGRKWGIERSLFGALLVIAGGIALRSSGPVWALMAWAPQLGTHAAPTVEPASSPHRGRIWHSLLAWQVTGFLGLTSLVFYIIVGWLPAILVQAGYPAATAGTLHGVLQLATAVPGLILGPMVRRMKDQRGIAIAVSLATCVSLLGLWQFPALAMLWVALFGFGAGAAFILGLTFVSLRTSHSHQAAALSGMAQCLGYSLAAAGPPLAGLAHDATGGWEVALACCAVATVLMAVLGGSAGRAATI